MKDKLRIFHILLYVLLVAGGCCFERSYGQLELDEESLTRSGLAGAQYDDEAFTEVDGDSNILPILNQDWAGSLGNDWRAAWFGSIEGPTTGEITISAEFEDGLEVTIGDQLVIDRITSKNRNRASGTMRMVKGEKLPISIKFITFNSKALEADATPQDKLNWRFQQAMYRAFYDAHVKARLPFSIMKEKKSKAVLRQAARIGALAAASKAEGIIGRPFDDPIANQWRARVYELAEALYQSARMQQSVPRYKAIRLGRGATLDTLDAPLFNVKDMKRTFMRLRFMDRESDRLKAIEKLLN